MRPRRMAAEIQPLVRPRPELGDASMRPRRMAAEICAGLGAAAEREPASMRPRRMAAEIARNGWPTARGGARLQ